MKNIEKEQLTKERIDKNLAARLQLEKERFMVEESEKATQHKKILEAEAQRILRYEIRNIIS